MTVWGRNVQNTTSTTVANARAMGGTFDGGTNQVLKAISAFIGASGNLRLAVYQGGGLDPSGPQSSGGATLIWDAGIVTPSGDGFITATHPGPNFPALTNNDPIWLAWKADDGTVNIWYTTTSAGAGDHQTSVGRWSSAGGSAPSSDETAGWESTWPTGDTGSYGAFWYSFYIDHETAIDRDQDGYRFYEDDAAVGSETAIANEDTNMTRSKESPFRLRIQTDVAGDAPAEAMTLQYKEVGDGSDEWRDVPL